jgi:hypothetical protein
MIAKSEIRRSKHKIVKVTGCTVLAESSKEASHSTGAAVPMMMMMMMMMIYFIYLWLQRY